MLRVEDTPLMRGELPNYSNYNQIDDSTLSLAEIYTTTEKTRRMGKSRIDTRPGNELVLMRKFMSIVSLWLTLVEINTAQIVVELRS